MVPALCLWITTYVASYLEDATDAAQGRNFSPPEAVLFGLAGGSIVQNIVDRFLKLSPEEREQVIEGLKNASFEPPPPFTQTFTRSSP